MSCQKTCRPNLSCTFINLTFVRTLHIAHIYGLLLIYILRLSIKSKDMFAVLMVLTCHLDFNHIPTAVYFLINILIVIVQMNYPARLNDDMNLNVLFDWRLGRIILLL